MKNVTTALILYFIAGSDCYAGNKGIKAATFLENPKQEVVAIENAATPATLEEAVYSVVDYKIKTQFLLGKIGFGHAIITEKRTEEKREIKVKLTGAVGLLARCFKGDDEIISLTERNQTRYIEFKKEYYLTEGEVDPLVYCLGISRYIKQPDKQKMTADGKEWWVWATYKSKEKIGSGNTPTGIEKFILNFRGRKIDKLMGNPVEVYFSNEKKMAIKANIHFLRGTLQVEGSFVE